MFRSEELETYIDLSRTERKNHKEEHIAKNIKLAL